MPIANGANGFNIGNDTKVVIQTSIGQIELVNVTGFKSAQTTTPVKVDRQDGIQLNAELPKGWTGSFEFARGSVGADAFFAAAESAWYLNGTYNVATIYQYVRELNGQQTTFQFDNVALKLEDAGDWKGDKEVQMRISFMANRRRIV